MSGFVPESHVAQQSRRDKLRVQQTSNSMLSHNHFHNFPNNSENPDIVQVRNVRNTNNLLYDPTVFSSSAEILNFDHTRSMAVGESTQNNFGNWRSTTSLNHHQVPQSLNWVTTNYASGGQVGSVSNFQNHNISSSTAHLKHPSTNYINGYQDHRVQSSNLAINPSSADQISSSHHHVVSQKQLLGGGGGGAMHPINYLNTLQDHQLEMASSLGFSSTAAAVEGSTGNELLLLPSYVDQSNTFSFNNAAATSSWMDRPHHPAENRHNWTSTSDSNQQGLSLSLSSNPPSKLPLSQFGDDDDLQNPKTGNKSGGGYLCSITKPSIISKACGKSLQDIVGSSSVSSYRNTGPLGPFTGYATILKSSKFLKPAQQLLDEFCRINGDSKLSRTCDLQASAERVSGDQVSASASVSVSVSNDNAVNAIETELVGKGNNNNSGASSSTFYGSNEISSDGGAAASTSSESFRPEYHQKKAKLLYMQEEVCRRYKQYHQQIEMVVSSFESVAGLSSATPYISLALNTVSRHFRCLTNSIKDQLKNISRALGEDHLASAITGRATTGCSSEADKSMAKIKYMGLGFQKHKPGGPHVAFSEPQPQVWRPQRGLPERSVAILRAWLFEHFLHPYPTDTDKHMLATQTGLSRNQVSNWFINARVRIWKPMVEEIHMLETRGSAEAGQEPRKKDENAANDDTSRPNNDQFGINTMPNRQLDCSGTRDAMQAEQQCHEKRSRLEYQVPSGMDEALMGFAPYRRSGLEVGGLGAVSLTLGLRHGVESAQQQQQQLQQQKDRLRRQFGSQMIRDFVG